MGPAKIKRWMEKRGVAVQAVEVLKTLGTPIIIGYVVTTKTGKSGKVAPDARFHDLENLRRNFIKT